MGSIFLVFFWFLREIRLRECGGFWRSCGLENTVMVIRKIGYRCTGSDSW